jgi:hypothetical protein
MRRVHENPQGHDAFSMGEHVVTGSQVVVTSKVVVKLPILVPFAAGQARGAAGLLTWQTAPH